jgi:septum formation protein
VVLGDVVLEKPADTEDAKRMLRQLAGQEHVVITCVCVADQTNIKELRVETKVRFKELSDGEIARYVATGEPMDKAGSYAAQGLGAYFIKSISGSYTNVIGLPMAELCDALSEFGFRF